MNNIYPDLCSRLKAVFLFLILLVSFSLSAQDITPLVLTGVVINQERSPVSGAAVCVLNAADSAIVKMEICDKNGSFSFRNLKSGRYLIRVSFVGYQKLFYGPFVFSSASQPLDAGQLTLNLTSTTLTEVSIVEKKNFIESKPGKMVLDVENSLLSTGSSAYDILRAAPGVQMDAQDNIRLNGKQNVLIVINGKQTFMGSEALIDILKSTQSSEIEQIELISNPSAKFDAAGSGAIINIKTKKDKKFGANGSVNSTAGISNIVKGHDPNFRFNSGLNLNYRNRFMNVFGNYTYADINQTRNISLDRDIDFTSINVDYQGLTRRRADSYRLGLDFNLSADHVIGVMVNGSNNQLHIVKDNRSAILYQAVLDSTIQTQSEQDRGLTNQVFNFNYKGSLGKRVGDISFDWDYITYHRKSLELLTNNFLDAGNNPYRESLLLKNSSPSEYDVQSIKLDYSVSLSKKAKLELGLQGSQVKGDSRLDFGRLVYNNFFPDSKFISHFLINERIGAAYFNYSIDFKKSSLSVGLRTEKTFSKGSSLISEQTNEREYFNFFPNLQFSHHLNQNNQLLFSYSRRITRPGYDNLTPFVAYLDQYSFRSGNPLLRPEFTRIAELTNIYKERFTATLRAKVINDLILEINEQDDVSHVNTIISRNIDRQYLYGLELNAPFEVVKWWNLNLNLQATYEKYIANSVSGEFENTSPSLILSTLQAIKINPELSAEINGKYESPTVYGIYNYKSAYSVDVAVAKSFFNKDASLRLRVTDLFNTASNRYSSSYQNLILQGSEKRDSRVAQISFSYLFGRRTVKAARKRDTGSESEQGRIGN